MNANINQIRKQYNNSISKIPEKKLKELYSSLYYEAYHTLFIERDDEAHQKAIKVIEGLSNENEPWKRFRASKDAIVEVPLQILMELHNKKIDEHRELSVDLSTVYLYFLKSENDLLNIWIDYVDQGLDEKRSLEFIKEQMVKVRDETSKLLENQAELIVYIINYLESKDNLSDLEEQGLKLLKMIKAENL